MQGGLEDMTAASSLCCSLASTKNFFMPVHRHAHSQCTLHSCHAAGCCPVKALLFKGRQNEVITPLQTAQARTRLDTCTGSGVPRMSVCMAIWMRGVGRGVPPGDCQCLWGVAGVGRRRPRPCQG